MSDRRFPLRKKDWKPGTWQIGLFIRMPDNSQVESVFNDAQARVQELALKLFSEHFPDVKNYLEEQPNVRPARLLPNLGEEDDSGEKR